MTQLRLHNLVPVFHFLDSHTRLALTRRRALYGVIDSSLPDMYVGITQFSSRTFDPTRYAGDSDLQNNSNASWLPGIGSQSRKDLARSRHELLQGSSQFST